MVAFVPEASVRRCAVASKRKLAKNSPQKSSIWAMKTTRVAQRPLLKPQDKRLKSYAWSLATPTSVSVLFRCVNNNNNNSLFVCLLNSWTARCLRIEHVHLPRVRVVQKRWALRLSDVCGDALREEDALHHAAGVRGCGAHPCPQCRASRSETRKHPARWWF